jgi:CheY-like chemotaxis protein
VHTPTPRRVLLVEDSENDIELTQNMLTNCGAVVRVDVARDGEEALDYLHRRGSFSTRPPGEPVLILLDLKMPKLGGLEVLRDVKANGAAQAIKNIPVVVFTSSRELQDVRECYRLGANGYVVKPVDASQYMEAIKHMGAFWGATNEPPPI